MVTAAKYYITFRHRSTKFIYVATFGTTAFVYQRRTIMKTSIQCHVVLLHSIWDSDTEINITSQKWIHKLRYSTTLINASIRRSEFKIQPAYGSTYRHVACLCDIARQSTVTRFPSADNYKFKPHLNRTDVADEFTVSTSIFGAFAKLRKATINFRHVGPSVRTKQLASHWTDFHEIWYILRKSV